MFFEFPQQMGRPGRTEGVRRNKVELPRLEGKADNEVEQKLRTQKKDGGSKLCKEGVRYLNVLYFNLEKFGLC